MDIKGFPIITTLSDSDYFLVQTASDGAYKSILASDLKTYFGGSGGGSSSATKNLTFSADGDSNGVFYYIGTALGTTAWNNPAGSSVIITPSSVGSGSTNTLTGRTPSDFWTNNSAGSSIIFSIGTHTLNLNHYTLQTRGSDSGYYPTSWAIQGSNDGSTWTTLDNQTNYTGFDGTAQWKDFSVTPSTSYSYFRIVSTGNDSNGSSYLCLGQIELYGVFTP
jgi:hypothetical protein